MITSTKNYTKNKTNKQKTDRQNPRTNGKSKVMQTNSHKEAYTYTLTKIEKEKIYIYISKKGREQPNQQTNLPMIINSKY